MDSLTLDWAQLVMLAGFLGGLVRMNESIKRLTADTLEQKEWNKLMTAQVVEMTAEMRVVATQMRVLWDRAQR